MASGRIKGITIEIDGNTTKLTKALSSVDNSIKNTQTNLRDLDKALQLDPGNTELLKDKQIELANEIEATKKKLETEKQALEQLKQSDGFDETSKEAQNLKTQIDLDTVALKDLEKQAKDSSSIVQAKFKAIGDKCKEVGSSIKAVGDKISGIGQDMTTKVTMPIAAGFAGVIKTTADFDSEMSKVQAISGASADDMKDLTDKAREMGKQTKYSATESGQAFEYMAMAGWKTEDMLNGIEGIMNLAAASGEELGTTSDIVTDALTAFNMEAGDAGRFADILAAAASNANTNVSMMGESFKYVAPVFGSMGYSAEDAAVALGLMANSGIKADMAGTSLRNMIQRMAKPTKESAAAMERLGIELADDEGNMYSFREIMDQMRSSFSEINMSAEDYDKQLDELDAQLADGTIKQSEYDKELEELNKQAFGAEGAEKARAAAMLGGARAMSGLLAIANASTEDYQKLQDAVDNSSQSFAKLADGSVVPLNEALASGQEIIEQYNGSAEAMAGTMMDNLTGDITVLKSQIQELAISLGELLMPLLRDIVEKIQGVVDWLNSLDDGTKETILTVAAVAAAIGPLLIVIGNVVSAIGTITTAIGFLLPILASPVGIVLAIIAAVAALAVAIYLNWDKIKAFLADAKEGWDKLVANIKQKIDDLKQKFDLFKQAIGIVWNAIKEAVVGKVKEVFDKVKTTFSNMKTNIQNTFTNIKNGITNTVGNIKNAVVNGFGKAVDFIKSLPSKALSWGKDLIQNFVNGIWNKIGAVTEVISNVADKVKSFLGFSEPEDGPLSNFHTFAPDMIKLFAQGIEQSLPMLERATNDMAAVIASDATPSIQNGQAAASKTVNAPISINVYGAQGQDVNQLADIIQAKMNRAVVNQKAVFA